MQENTVDTRTNDGLTAVWKPSGGQVGNLAEFVRGQTHLVKFCFPKHPVLCDMFETAQL